MGSCHVVNFHTDYSEGYGVQYANTQGNEEEDNEEFTVTQVDEATQYVQGGADDDDGSAGGGGGGGGGPAEPLSPLNSNATHSPGGFSSPPTLSCEDEFTTVSMVLSSACKTSTICTPSLDSRFEGTSWAASFVPDLLLARLHLRPRFTTRSLRRAYVDMLDNEAAKKRDLEPNNLAKSHSAPLLLYRHLEHQPDRESPPTDDRLVSTATSSSSGDNDYRLQQSSSTEMKTLNPFEVTAWVREQFTPDRMEINIVGDFGEGNNMTSFLDDLNVVFGTIPPYGNGQTRVGLDVYAANDASHFTRTFNVEQSKTNVQRRKSTPSVQDITDEACFVKHLYSRRSYVTALVPSFDGVDGTSNAMSILSAHLTKRLVWSTVRKEHGLSYSIHTSHFHSVLFPKYGYTYINIEVGPYNTKDSTNDPMNVQFSLDQISTALKSNRKYDTKLFSDSKSQLLMDLKHEFSNSEGWIAFLRGMSLNMPHAMALTHSSEGNTGSQTLKDIQASDMFALIEKIDQKGFVEWTRIHGPMSDAVMLSSVVETVNDIDPPVHANEKSKCNPIPF
jgi:hypothetical protein